MLYALCAVLGGAVLTAIFAPLFRKEQTLESAIIEETEWDLLQRKKEVILGNVQDLDFEHKCGKLSDADHQKIRTEMMGEAAEVMDEIEKLETTLDLDALIRREVTARKGRAIQILEVGRLRRLRGEESRSQEVLRRLWSEADCLMRTSFKLLLPISGWMLTTANPLIAQNDGARTAQVPNSMGIHTWFIILAFGALLTWCISYSLQVQKEAQARRKGREDIVRYKDEILDEIAALEERKEAGQITDSKYNKELKELKTRLSRVIEQLGKR